MIRQAGPEDEAAIRNCADLAYARYVPLIGRKPAPMLADYAAQIAAGVVHLAEDAAGAFQGFIVFYPEDGAMLLENVAVLPKAAGQGVGRALMAFCEDCARQQGLPAIRLYTNAKMTENLSIYPRLGYVQTGRRQEDGFDRVFFEKPL
ncbi:GNAT family N-acetyltransferase [Neotabrizicola sp. VNH66]|uniref:GNAT family N-acetyltransferase n=1 Tax=Neotabrizicola sp. VNH66 TaxID=3400918 RepID=UPI003C065167